MSLSDGGRVCMTCRFFDDCDSRCQRFPPRVSSTVEDEDGDPYVYWGQPIIDLEWSMTCGEWQAAAGCDDEEERLRQVSKRIEEVASKIGKEK